jgi:hypothetical protein
MSQFDWPITKEKEKKKLKLWRLSKTEDSMERWRVPSLWPYYIGEKGRILGKHMGLKQVAIGNTLGEHIGNFENILRT